MEIEEIEGPAKYEVMPTERTLYLTAVHYKDGAWMSGPGGVDKAEVVKQLSYWIGIDAARIYAVKVPVSALPAA